MADTNQLLPLTGAAGALGFLSHVGYFARGEHHLQAYRLFLAAITAPAVITTILSRFYAFSVVEAALYATAMWWAYFVALWTSMVVYRLFFHRLSGFDGPLMWKISKPFGWLPAITKLDNYKVVAKLHQQYGDYVRTGMPILLSPMELSIIDPAAVEHIYGPRSKCEKPASYDGNHPLTSLHEMRNRPLHDRRRRTAWDPGFSMKSLRDYESRVQYYSDELIRQLSTFGGKSVNATAWMLYFGFDIMGSLVFGKSFDMLSRGEGHWAIQIMRESLVPYGLVRHCPWLLNMLKPMPLLTNQIKKFEKYSDESYDDRIRNKPAEQDIMSHFIKAEPLYPEDPFKQKWLEVGDSKLVVIAGSDTTSSTLTYAMYHLAHDPSHQTMLREELKSANINLGEGFKIQQLQDLKYLNGFIHEVLRLHPALPSGVQRITPPEGLQIGDRFIPGGIDVAIPSWALHRSPKAYPSPDTILPSRWFDPASFPNSLPPNSSFLTFGGTSNYGCIGKNLALQELRTVLSKIVLRFEVGFAPGENGRALLEESLDTFVISPKQLYVEFRERN